MLLNICSCSSTRKYSLEKTALSFRHCYCWIISFYDDVNTLCHYTNVSACCYCDIRISYILLYIVHVFQLLCLLAMLTVHQDNLNSIAMYEWCTSDLKLTIEQIFIVSGLIFEEASADLVPVNGLVSIVPADVRTPNFVQSQIFL